MPHLAALAVYGSHQGVQLGRRIYYADTCQASAMHLHCEISAAAMLNVLW